MQILGYILIALGAADFLLGNFGNINLTGFMGPLSSFTIVGLLTLEINNYNYFFGCAPNLFLPFFPA